MTDREAFEAWLAPLRGQICPPHPEDYLQVWRAALAYERAKQAEPVATVIKTAVTNEWLFNECFAKYPTGIYQLYAAPPADDEAVRLLKKLRSLDEILSKKTRDEIDAYLAKAEK